MGSMTDIRTAMRQATLADEATAVAGLIDGAALDADQRKRISERATGLVNDVRAHDDPGLMEEFLAEYGLSSKEGVALMCLAEALLRVPDAETIDDLIQDKIAPHDWGAHLGRASSSLVNASTWALMLTGRVVDDVEPGVLGTLHGLVKRMGEPVVRLAVSRAMREMGAQFVLGRDIGEAIKRGQPMVDTGYTYSYDMLGEAARTDADAQRYHGAYAQAIAAITHRAKGDVRDNPGISVKLSALHPRYEATHAAACVPVLIDRLGALARAAAAANMGLNVDAEEADRLDLSLEIIEGVLADPRLAGWDGFGVVVQAYGPRAAHVIDWLDALAERLDRRIMVRLVKGAYWDTEIKRAQVLGLDGFPVFTRKVHTDLSYIACARKLLGAERIYPQFATHNAHTAAAVLEMAGNDRDSFEFQRLHGMGEALHGQIRMREDTRCRIYAPVGAHRDLLAYLVRRLLENGANSSFVHQIVDEDIPAETIAADPFLTADLGLAAPGIAQGPDVYGAERRNALGWDITDAVTIDTLDAVHTDHRIAHWGAGDPGRPGRDIRNPARIDDLVGIAHDADPGDASTAMARAQAAQPAWAALGAEARADVLERAADLYEANAPELFALLAREAGKTWLDQVGEMREAVDFLRYYAVAARKGIAAPLGVVACISPWNFPLAIFTGQIAAALVAGNAVLAKPAEQTPLIAERAVALLHQAGVPGDVLQTLHGDGRIGAALVALPGLGGVAFTGSTEVAQRINRQLAETAPNARLIAETGGLNAMIVDSTALPEQAVRDIIASAFQSAGQRCSALRMVYIQADVEERFLDMLFGAMDALSLGDPIAAATDLGPLIDAEAKGKIAAYCQRLEGEGRLLHKTDAPSQGHFLAPHVFRVKGIAALDEEIFGPVLHVARFQADQIDAVLDAVNAKGYGLTFGLHTRVDARVQHVIDRVSVGNVYVNRNQIGAIVGSQPFGGHGLSGTGPKAGGPLYLSAFTRDEGAATAPDQGGPASAQAVTDALEAVTAWERAPLWAARRDRNAALRAALRGKAGAAMSAAAALDHGPIDLPGPTGESNRYRLLPLGTVLCLGPSEALLDQVVQALASGNAVAAVAPGANRTLAPLLDQPDLPLVAVDGQADPADLRGAPLDAVAYHGRDADTVVAQLALRAGPITRLIVDRIAPASYAVEQTICIDTTAAGGNTALLAEQA